MRRGCDGRIAPASAWRAVGFAAASACRSRAIVLYGGQRAETERILYVRSADAIERLALDFDALAADVYWIRAIQHYGGDRLAPTERRAKYELLYPLLDLTTTLDPYFTIAYRFGAIFLSEPYPGGPGSPDQAIALLREGHRGAAGRSGSTSTTSPSCYYWHLRDSKTAAHGSSERPSSPNAPNWLRPLAASMLTAGKDRKRGALPLEADPAVG